VRADHEILKSVETNAGQSHEHTHGGLAPCSCHLHAGKGATDSLDGRERVPAFIADPLAR
jgi:hypothetical protein